MREEIADLVYPVFTRGLRMREKLADGEPLDFATSQKELQGLLQSTSQAQRLADFGGDKPVDDSMRGARGDHFLGIRYALVCWLDEIFILDSSWKDKWSEHSLEVDLYKSRERAWKFWEQADWASARPTTDALEVFFLCVMLGFRGDKAEKSDDLAAWCERIKAQLEQGQEAEFKLPVGGQPGTYVPPLRGAKRQQNMLMVAGVALLILVPALVFLLLLPSR